MEYPCGGNGICGKCVIRFVPEEAPVPNAVERRRFSEAELKAGYRLSCQTKKGREAHFKIGNQSEAENPFVPEKQSETEKLFLQGNQLEAENPFLQGKLLETEAHLSQKERLAEAVDGEQEQIQVAVAVDLGTTTVEIALLNAESTSVKPVASARFTNPQRKYGHDVLSRIQYANQTAEGGRKLQQCIQEELQNQILSLVRRYEERIWEEIQEGQESQRAQESENQTNQEMIQDKRNQRAHKQSDKLKVSVQRVAIAGNTTMCHLLLGYSLQGLGTYPFTPVSLKLEHFFYQNVEIYVLPGVSAFIGGDILSGLFALDCLSWEEPHLLLDLGTNGEMVYGSKGKLVATSASAGPAFEGGNISWGVANVPGAICQVLIAGNRCHVTTLGGVDAVGICGSGLVSAIAGMKKNKILSSDWVLKEPYFLKGYPLADFHTSESEQENANRDAQKRTQITVSQEDIRQFQLAKSAIVTGYEILMEQAAAKEEAEQLRIILAGGFGIHLKKEDAVSAGLLKQEWIGRVENAGNTALQGAIKFLQDPSKAIESIEEIKKQIQVIALTEQKSFEKLFLQNLM